MSDVKLIIKIPEEEYNIIKKSNAPMTWVEHLIAKGIPLSKNDLEVDTISRADAIKAMQDKAKKLTNEDIINGLYGAVAILYEMPSVTPIKPKGHWIEVLGGCKCSRCDMAFSKLKETCADNYCPNCGSDNREVEE